MKKIFLLPLILMGLMLQAQNADQFSGDLARSWYNQQLKLTKATPGFTPPVASRALAYTGIGLYEAVVPGMPGLISMAGRLAGFPTITQVNAGDVYHWPTVANNAFSRMLDSLYHNAPAVQLDTVHQLRDAWNAQYQAAIPADVYQRSVLHGEAVAADVFAFSATDGGYRAQLANFPPSYVPPVGPGFWVPLAGQTALQPYWGQKRPFLVADTSAALDPPGHPAFDTNPLSVFYGFANEVYTTNLNLTAEQTNIARFYADGTGSITPPGHSVNVLTQVLRQENANLAVAAQAYARVGMAVADAFVMCWKTKYEYNLLRPITYIQAHIAPGWTPLIGTPPFPEYASGHSTQSGAFAEAMDAMFGAAYSFTDSTYLQYGGPRTLPSFDDWAAEAAVSRLYGGIHFRFGNEDGLACGTAVGQNINAFFDGLLSGVANVPEIGILACSPNPTQGVLNLTGDLSGIARIQVYDAAGRAVTSLSAQPSLDLTGFAQGFYVLRAFDGQGRTLSVARLLKQ